MSETETIAARSWSARHAAALTATGLFFITLVLYWPMIAAQFVVVDDDRYVYENPWVSRGFSFAGLRWAFTSTYAANWHPLTWISHMIDCSLHGLFPGGHHLTNIVLHSINTVLLFLFLKSLTGDLWPGTLAAALFAWHPLHVESVAWISERKDVLSTLFFLLTLLFYMRYAQKQSQQQPRVEGRGSRVTADPAWERQRLAGECGQVATATGRRGRRRSQGLALDPRLSTLDYCLALLFFALGLMSKPTLVTLPCVLLLLDYWPLGRISRLGFRVPDSEIRILEAGAASGPKPGTRNSKPAPLSHLVLEKLPFFALSLAASVVTVIAQHAGGAIKSVREVPLSVRALNVPVAYVRYLIKTLCPVDLCVFYPLPASVSVLAAIGSFLAIAGICCFAYRQRYASPWLMVGWFWFLGSLVPVIGLVQIGSQALADRYTYIPSIGLFLSLAWMLRGWMGKGRLERVLGNCAAPAILLPCLMLTRFQLSYWHDSVSLFTHALSVTGSNAFSENNLGVALSDADRGTEAIPHYLAALRFNPDDVKAHYNVGIELADAGERDQALAHFLEGLKHDPKSEKLHNNIGVILAQQDHLDSALEYFRKAAELNPNYPKPYLNCAVVLQKQGVAGPAVTNYLKALELEPTWAEALARLAFLVSACPESQWHNPAEGIKLAERANQITGSKSPEYLDTLAVAYAAAGQFSNAVFVARLAARQAHAKGFSELAQKIENNLTSYQAGTNVQLDWRSPAEFEIQR